MMYQPVTTLMLMQIRVVLYFCNMSWIDVVARQAGLVMHMLADQQGFVQCTTFMQDEATKNHTASFCKASNADLHDGSSSRARLYAATAGSD